LTITEFMDRYAAGLTLYARAWCDGPEDVVAVAFGKFAQLAELPRDPQAWLFTVVRNGAMDAGKSERRRARRERAASRPEAWFVESQVDGIDATEAVVALQALPEVEREVIIARLWGELTLEQIATVQGCALSTVHRRYEAGIAALQERFGVIWPS
jgi:RNA polymerase sigma factor (sigma-70 family)